MKLWGADSAELKRAWSLSDVDLVHAKSLFQKGIAFRKIWPDIKIDNHRFSEALDLRNAIFLSKIKFTNCCFERSVDFFDANFELGASFSGSKFLDEVNFGQAQFGADATFDGVTFCGQVHFYC